MDNNQKTIDPAIVASIGLLGIIIVGIVCIVVKGDSEFYSTIIIIFIVFTIIMLGGMLGVFVSNSNDKERVANLKREFQQEYDDYTNKLQIVKSDTQVTLIEINENDLREFIPHYLWIFDGYLKLFPISEYYKQNHISTIFKPDINKLKLKSISIESILYFEEFGELRRYAKVSGGGSSLKGALFGYMLADDVGAVIGSRQPIKTEIISEDDRKIELIYKNGDNIENLEFAHDAYEALRQLLPSKELRRIKALNENVHENEVQKKPVKERLKQLEDLKENGLITTDEYSRQREKILNSI